VAMPSYKQLQAATAGCCRAYLAYHGPDSLAPVRSEPMKFRMVQQIERIPTDGSFTIGQLQWRDSDHNVFMMRRLNRLMIVSGFRLGEIVQHTSHEVMHLTLSSLSWLIGGVTMTRPTRAQLCGLRPGRDKALVSPPRAKPDQWGEIHCPFPVSFTYSPDNPIDAASGLRDIELMHIAHGQPLDRSATALFCDINHQPYTHHYLHHLLRCVLPHLYGERVARLYSWHSYRLGLATALHAAKVDDGMIQLICRWMCPKSLHVYRRMGTNEHERLTRSAMTANVELIQSTNIPKIDADQMYAQVNQDLGPDCPEWDAASALSPRVRDEATVDPAS